jgi:hypothetical protein
MADKSDWLTALAELRGDYKDFLAAVDEDLARERQKRIASRQGDIINAVIQAYTLGASLAEIKRAYGTKDHNTIKKIVGGAQSQADFMKKESPKTKPDAPWFEIKRAAAEAQADYSLYTGDAQYAVYTLEGGEFLLDFLDGEEHAFLPDGTVLAGGGSQNAVELHRELTKWENGHYG